LYSGTEPADAFVGISSAFFPPEAGFTLPTPSPFFSGGCQAAISEVDPFWQVEEGCLLVTTVRFFFSD